MTERVPFRMYQAWGTSFVLFGTLRSVLIEIWQQSIPKACVELSQ